MQYIAFAIRTEIATIIKKWSTRANSQVWPPAYRNLQG